MELINSLPHLSDPFRVPRPPISTVQLRKRFNMLLPEDRKLMDSLWQSMLWSSIPLATADEFLSDYFRRILAEVTEPQLHQWLCWRMDVRTILAALRRRHLGLDAPLRTPRWTSSDLMGLITVNWGQPAFGLSGRFPWLPEAQQLLESGASLALEKLVLECVWRYFDRCQPDNAYGFSAVFLYVSRWDICLRWSRYDHDLAAQRFDQLVADSLQSSDVYFEEWS